MKYVDVYVEHNSLQLNQTFTYSCPFDVKVGCRVQVPFGRNELVGIVQDIHDTTEVEKTKEVIRVIDDESLLNDEMMEMADWMSQQYVCSKISCLKTMLPPALKPSSKKAKIIYEDWIDLNDTSISLTEKQKNWISTIQFPIKASLFRKQSAYMASALIKNGYVKIVKREKREDIIHASSTDTSFTLTNEQKKAINEINQSDDQTFLLHGITGSGKTEVFLQLAQQVLDQGQQVLFLVPEIGLTPMMINRVTARFGKNIAIYHSHLNAQEKYTQYQLVKEHKVNIVVGTRSAIFMPFTSLGLILMDEEHDGSYKQDNIPRYQTRDVVLWRAKYHHCKVVLASATPSLESYSRAYKEVYHLVELKHRIHVTMPDIHLVDMKHEHTISGFSETLIQAIQQRLENQEQVILLLNRRGYLPIVRCMDCNSVITCPECNIALTYHKREDVLKCHCCGNVYTFNHRCPECNGHHFFQSSLGTERLEEDVKKLFPTANIFRMDADSMRKKHAHETLLKEFEENGDILLGTQMVAKGLDFPKVTLVGILQADASLTRMDYRSAEVAYEMLEQASGRSGRGTKKGDVFIQTFDPDHYVMKSVVTHNYRKFFAQEMSYRHLGMYPPYSYLCTVIYSHTDEKKAREIAEDAKLYLFDMKVIGPIEISMRQRKKRVRIVVRSNSMEKLENAIWKLVDHHLALKTNVKQDINMFPYMLEE